MSRSSSTYVSPNLAPTSEWAHQTSTGVFRPPPVMSLQPSSTTNSPGLPAEKHVDLRPLSALPASTAERARELHGLGFDGDGPSGPSARGAGAERRPFSSPSPLIGPASCGVSPSLPPVGALPASPHDALPVLMKMIRYAVHAEQDAFAAQKKSNRVLEAELQRVQEQRKATTANLAAISKSTAALRAIANDQKAMIVLLTQESA